MAQIETQDLHVWNCWNCTRHGLPTDLETTKSRAEDHQLIYGHFVTYKPWEAE